MFDTPLIPFGVFDTLPILSNWSKPHCGLCEAAGYRCRLKNHTSSSLHTECYTTKPAPQVAQVVGSTNQSQHDCGQVEKCEDNGPDIRFPFALKEHCAYPGFQLRCDQNRDTILELNASSLVSGLPYSIRFSVKNIDYLSQLIVISPRNVCLPGLLQILDLSSVSPFQLRQPSVLPFQFDEGGDTFVLYCSKMEQRRYLHPVPCLSSPDYHVYAGWSRPHCGWCEAAGKHCRLKNHTSISPHTECYTTKPQGPLPKLRVAGEVLGPLLATLLAIALYWVYNSIKLKKESELKIEKFLVDYKALKPTRYSYADLKKITDNFNEKLGEGGYGTVYKGKLSNDVFVAIKVLTNSKGDGEEFINEVSTIGRIHHVNVVRLVGYCADGFRRALVYEFMPNDSLQKFVSSDRQRCLLGWERLHRIAVDIAKGIEYLHQGCEQRILHFDIKPNNILLDGDFNPKIADFGLAKLCSKEQSMVSMTVARGTIGYIAPEVFSRNFGKVSYKSDVYSFGMLLLEMVGGLKKDEVGGQDKSEVYFPEWIYNKLEQGEEITIQIEKEGDDEIVRRLTIVGLWCIQWYPVERPSMKGVIKMLELEEIPSMPRNPFTSTNGTRTTSTALGRMFSSELEVISESE